MKKKTLRLAIGCLALAGILPVVLFAACKQPSDYGSHPTYRITVKPVPNGTITADKEEAAFDEEVLLTITPKNDEYELTSLSVTTTDNKIIHYHYEDDDTRSFFMPEGIVTVIGSFGLKSESPGAPKYAIDVIPSANGTVSAGVEEAASGVKVTVTVEAADGYKYRNKSLLVKDEAGTVIPTKDAGGNTFVFTMPESAVTVTAQFEVITGPNYAIAVIQSANGAI